MAEHALAAVVRRFGEALELEEVPLPELVKGSLLVKVEAATLCGTDVHFWRGGLSDERLPYIPGHETVGTVVDANDFRTDVTGQQVSVGDRIIWSYPFCGSCFYCSIAHQPTLCQQAVRFGRERSDKSPYLLGGCATHHYVPPGAGVVKVPPQLSAPLAASAACALRTVMHAFERLGPTPILGENVLIQGAGPVGLYAVAVAASRGFSQIAVIGAPEDRLDAARRLGADATLDFEVVSDRANRMEWALSLTEARGFDVVLQCAGTNAIPEGLELVRSGGSFISIGVGGPSDLSISSGAFSGMKTIMSVSAAEVRHYYQAVEFLADHAEECGIIISGSYDLAGVAEAFQAMVELKEIKPVIRPEVASSLPE